MSASASSEIPGFSHGENLGFPLNADTLIIDRVEDMLPGLKLREDNLGGEVTEAPLTSSAQYG